VDPAPALHHLALRVSDCDRSARFYGTLLGLPELRRLTGEEGELRAVWLRVGQTVLMLERRLRGKGPGGGSGHVLSLAVDDLASWRQRLAGAGVEVDDATPATLFVRDPDGHRVGLSTYRF
jgi:glyoxylase I family protein